MKFFSLTFIAIFHPIFVIAQSNGINVRRALAIAVYVR
jgi:hypothetical protein